MKEKIEKLSLIVIRNTWTLFVFSLLLIICSRFFMYLLYVIFNWGETGNFIYDINNIWDNGWYKGIINQGYNIEPSNHAKGDAANWAFFPLSSILIRILYNITKCPIEIIGFLLNTFLLALAITVAMKYVLFTRKDSILAIELALVLAFGPYTFYCSCLYTESLYLVLIFLSFYFLKKKKYITMGICGALLSATRNTGIFFVFAIAMECIIQEWKNNKSVIQVIKNILGNSKLVLGTSLVPMGLFGYMAYLRYLVGDSLAFVRIQKAWQQPRTNPISKAIEYFQSENIRDWYIVILVIVVLFLIGYQVKRGKITEMFMPFLIIAIQSTSMYVSMPRYLFSTGMIELGMLEYINNEWPRHKHILFFLILVILSVLFLKLWFLWDTLMR